MEPSEKLAELKRLGALRRASVVPEGCFALADFHDGYYETEFVSPWTKSACNVDAQVALVLQDWCGSDYLAGPVKPTVRALGHDPNLPTNRNLTALLAEAGLSLEQVFGTNAFPWIKHGRMNAKLESSALASAVERFVLPQLIAVRTSVAVLFGKMVREAVGRVLNEPPPRSLLEAIEVPFTAEGVTFVTVAHTGSKIHLHRGWDGSVKDWQKIGPMID